MSACGVGCAEAAANTSTASANASRLARAEPGVAHGRASNSTSRPSSRSAVATTSGSGCEHASRTARTADPSHSRRSRAAALSARPWPSVHPGGGRSSTASTSPDVSGRPPAGTSGIWPATRSRALAQAPNTSRSSAPNATTGPESNRISRSERAGSAAAATSAVTSPTSGVDNNPPSPTTSTCIPRAPSAWITAGNWVRRRHRTAAVLPDLSPAASSLHQCPATQSATASASASTCAHRPTCTRPSRASGEGTSRSTRTGEASVSGAAIALAQARIASSLRQLVESGSTGVSAPPAAKRRGKLDSVVELAPRHP